ncbi:MAG: hypothetical protein K2P88_14285 [Chitinophagaceae bacterium]|uniref:hypothetical protein n=1 Tax=unclassified Paraflavitalea TaxID=2798305 RepID=UPI003D35768D|nr:hypothetical protein [Chitinophagaceae bacterium]
MTRFLNWLDFPLFTGVWLSFTAVLMVWQTQQYLILPNELEQSYWSLVACSTLASYNLHWFLSPNAPAEIRRSKFTHRYGYLHLTLTSIGALASVYFAWQLRSHWIALTPAAILTFLYTAPKIPAFRFLEKFAIGKTIYLAAVWTYVTAWLPLHIAEATIQKNDLIFFFNRFFYIYAICILFDLRDREYDKSIGIKSLITYLPEKGVENLFYSALFLTLATSFLFPCAALARLALLIPVGALIALYKTARKSNHDYLYYGLLDGLMAAPAWLLIVLGF